MGVGLQSEANDWWGKVWEDLGKAGTVQDQVENLQAAVSTSGSNSKYTCEEGKTIPGLGGPTSPTRCGQ
jgi:thiamine biosynthesis lipoprotein ApbE